MKPKFNILTLSEDVVQYVFDITNSSPKKLRLDVIPKLREYSMKTMEHIIRANSLDRSDHMRTYHQDEALINLNLLESMANICKRNNYITFHQLDVLCDKTFKLNESISHWQLSDQELCK